jgi:hypothetical protein
MSGDGQSGAVDVAARADRCRLAPLPIAAAAFALYGLWAPPSFYWLDSAELTAAGVQLGVPHPTGFPAYIMMAKAAALVPFGELAFRVNLLSALAAAVAVGVTCRLVIDVGRQTTAAIAAGLAAGAVLGSSLFLARHATVAEVYAPTAAVFALTLLAIDRVARGGGARTGLSLAVLCGVGLGLHPLFRLLVPIPVIALLVIRLRRGARWPLYAPVLALAVGAAMQLALPARSATGRIDAVDWGHPRTAAALADHLSAERIRASYTGEMLSRRPVVVAGNAATFASSAAAAIGPVALLLAVLGAGWLAVRRRSRWLLASLVCALAIDATYSIWINPMGLRDLQNGTPTAVCAAVLAGVGLAWFLGRLGRAAPFAGAVIAVLAALPPLLESHAEIAGGAATEMPRRWSEAALESLPPRAVAFTRSDSLSAGLMFLTAAEGARPDVAALVRQHLADRERTARLLGVEPGDVDPRRLVTDLARAGRPLGWEIADDPTPSWVAAGMPIGVTRVASQPAADNADIAASARALARMFEGSLDDPLARRVLAHSLTSLGRVAYGRGAIDRASDLFDAALAIRPRHVEALINRGVVYSRRNRLREAVEITERALAVDPNRVAALINAARYRTALGDFEIAERHARRALEIEPDNDRARALGGVPE